MDERCKAIWEKLSAALKPQVSADTFKRWFSAVELTKATEDELTFVVPNNIYQFWIESNHMAALQSAITDAVGAPRTVRFLTSAESDGDDDFTAPEVRKTDGSGHSRTVGLGLGLNPRNTFESFVVGPNNQIAHAACLAVAQAPARTYNPLFIYGGVGLGKTHLMQAIGQYLWAKKKTSKVMYLSSELFINEFIDAIQHNTLVKFRKRYRQTDLLLIDDIQFLAGKERSQEEFFHTFNTLFDGHKQIVLSSDRPASEIANLEHRLVSRFEWGLTAELQPPDIETRLAILRKKARALQIKLHDDVYQFLATRIRSNVRRLEGALMRVASFASLSGKELTQETIEHLLKDILLEEAAADGHDRANPAQSGGTLRRAFSRHDEQAPAGQYRFSAPGGDVSGAGINQGIAQRNWRRVRRPRSRHGAARLQAGEEADERAGQHSADHLFH